MFRILGFILGSAISIAGVLMVLGMPEINLSSDDSDQARFDAALQKIRQRQEAIEERVHATNEVVPPVNAAATQVVRNAETIPAAESFSPVVAESTIEPITEQQDINNPGQRWHEFWNPFRSELAARGFVTQLEKVTGLDYRVMKIDAGVYQVGFAYADDNERRTKISQISAATGLDLPQS